MTHYEAPPSAGTGPDAAERLVEDMLAFLRGGPIPEPSEEGADPAARRHGTATWTPGAPTADPAAYTPSPAGAETDPGREIGPYRILRRVARGGMGVVFHARHRDLPREVALKMIRADLDGRTGVRARFKTEAAAVAKLDHPNIIKLFDFDEHGGELYLAMEWAPGGNLAARLKAGAMTPRQAAALVRDLARAMAYAHERKVIHRDLKPNNVLLAADGTPKVADFGLARLLDDGDTRMTRTDAIMGTPAYMAPEQAEGRNRDVDARADVYALGAILYEALAGVPPFDGEPKAVLRQVVDSTPAKPSSLAPGLSADLEAVCLHCLSKDADDRYQSAAELAADLDRFLAGEPTRARPPSRLRRVVRYVRRRTRVVAVGGLVAALCVATALTVAAVLRPPSPPDGEIPAVRQILEADLRAGRPATLIGPTGWPKWFRWRAGSADDRRLFLARDGVLSVESEHPTAAARLELLPDPASTSYRVTAQLRHDWSQAAGRIGVYAANVAQPGPRESQVFLALRFNGVVGVPTVIRPVGPNQGKAFVEPGSAAVDLGAEITANRPDRSPFEVGVADATGTRLPTRGVRSGYWYNVELTVRPEGVTATLDGDRLVVSAADLRRRMPAALGRLQGAFVGDTDVAGFTPDFAPRGGLGLYLHRGGVSLRSVTVTPLND